MKTRNFLYLLLLLPLFTFCDKNIDFADNYHEIRLIARDANTNTCIVEFVNEDSVTIDKMFGKSPTGQYNAANMNWNADYDEGKLMKIKARKAKDTEFPAGKMMNPSFLYPYIFVTDYQSADFNYNEIVEIPVNSSMQSMDGRFIIRFDSVFYDSRCPVDVVCVWAGAVGTRFVITEKNAEAKTVELFTPSFPANKWNDTIVFNGLTIKLLDVTPYPSTKTKFIYTNFRAKIQLTKSN